MASGHPPIGRPSKLLPISAGWRTLKMKSLRFATKSPN
jgi:hypothetical protein